MNDKYIGNLGKLLSISTVALVFNISSAALVSSPAYAISASYVGDKLKDRYPSLSTIISRLLDRRKCEKFESVSKRYRCNYTGGKWWKGAQAPVQKGVRRLDADGESWYYRRTLPGSGKVTGLQAVFRTTFLDKAATGRRIRQANNNRMNAASAGQFVFGLSIPVSVIWSGTSYLKTVAAASTVAVNTLYLIGTRQWIWAVNDENLFNLNRGLCYYSVAATNSGRIVKGGSFITPNTAVRGVRKVFWGWYSEELNTICR